MVDIISAEQLAAAQEGRLLDTRFLKVATLLGRQRFTNATRITVDFAISTTVNTDLYDELVELGYAVEEHPKFPGNTIIIWG